MSGGSDPSPADAVSGLSLSGSTDEVEDVDEQDAGDEAVDEATSDHQTAEGVETMRSLGSRDGLKNALLRTGPNKPLDKVNSPWDPEAGGITRIYRGLQKMLDFDGTPAVVDVVVGTAEFVQAFEPEGGDVDEQEASDETVDVDEGAMGV